MHSAKLEGDEKGSDDDKSSVSRHQIQRRVVGLTSSEGSDTRSDVNLPLFISRV